MEIHNNVPSQQTDGAAGANTVLLVIIILIIVAAAIWFFGYRRPAVETPSNTNNPSLNLDVHLPGGSGTATGGASQ